MMMKNKIISNYDFSGSEMLDCDVCGNFSNVTGQPLYTETPDDYEVLIEEYKKSGSKKTFNDWLNTDSSKAKYLKSGSKKTFKEWLSQDSTKNILSSVGLLGSYILTNQNNGKQDVLDKEKDKESENKTNWMLVGGLVLGGIAVSVLGIYLFKRN